MRKHIPIARRPSLSGYVQAGKLLPWQWVSACMEKSTNYWIATVDPRMPASRPVWGIWIDPNLLFGTGSRIARNIRADARVQVNLESGDEVVVIEGRAKPLDDRALVRTYAARYRTKYNWDIPEDADDLYVVEPIRVLAWIVDGTGLDGGAMFSNSATEWRFSASPSTSSRSRDRPRRRKPKPGAAR